MKRREFISAATAALCASQAGASAAAAAAATRAGRERPLRLLILGGTQFIGVHITQLALKRGHHVTLFNRGKSNPGLFPQVERLVGDRDDKLQALRGGRWDAVIDDSGYIPRHVRLSAQLLAPHVHRYLFISSISAYDSFATANDENSPLARLKDDTVEDIGNGNYGGLKALCEKTLTHLMPNRSLVLRPGFVVGPNDPTDRFTYWPVRAAQGGPLLAPGTPATAVQFIDVRDLARFALDCVERNLTGTFNVVTPPGAYTMGGLIAASCDAAEALAHPSPPPAPVWVSEQFLERQQVGLPIWEPPSGETAGFAQVSAARALGQGLTITPIATTTRDTLQWYLGQTDAARTRLKAGLPAAKETELLSAWSTQRS